MKTTWNTAIATAAVFGRLATAQSSCSSTISASYAAPSLADGFVARIVANGLSSPRGIRFDSGGSLLVVQEGVGISAHTIEDTGSDCLSVSNSKVVVENKELNHGIEISEDGTTLYGSDSTSLWAWDYSPQERATTSEARELVNGMNGSDHTSRTLLLSKAVPGILVINRGSFENIDDRARDITTGVSQVKAFNISSVTDTPYDFPTQGVLLGWGLRNDVGLVEHPTTGGIWSVENSADNVERSGSDIHEDNPAEKLQFLGYLNGTESPNQGRNFGYPDCFAAWAPDDIPDFDGEVGEQFSIGNPSPDLNDTTCDSANRQGPRLVFDAHMAPLDIIFNPNGTAAWISFHGSWNRDSPLGYKLSIVEYQNGEPTAPSNSTTAAKDIMSNPDLSACPSGCFRPVGLAWDSKGRLFMSSDSTGEIYVVTREDGNATSSVGTNAPIEGEVDTATSTESGAAAQTSTGAGSMVSVRVLTACVGVFAYLLQFGRKMV